MFRRKKQIELDTRAKIDIATTHLNNAFIMFSQANDAVEEAQLKLKDAISESDKKVISLKAQLDTELSHQQLAKDAITANEGLKTRLQDFILK